MDARVFDQLARQLGSSVPRRTLGGLLATILTMIGLPDAIMGKKREKADGRQSRRRHGHDRVHHGRRAADQVHDEKRKKGKKRKKKKKGQPQSPPPPGNASPPPPQSPPPPGGGDDDFFSKQTYEACVTPLAEPIATDLNTNCQDLCADHASEACQACYQEVIDAFTPAILECLQAGVIAGSAATARDRKVEPEGGVARTPKLGICQGSKYVIEMQIALRDGITVVSSAVIAALLIETGQVVLAASVLKYLKEVAGVAGAANVVGKISDVETKYGCRSSGITGRCVVEHPGPYGNTNDGICCPLTGDPRPCGDMCYFGHLCERCVGGQVQTCPTGEYCRRQRMGTRVPTITYTCTACPSCTGVCETLGTPGDQSSDTSPCPPRVCDGTCSQQGQTCRNGQCVVCTRKTCLELGKTCGTWDDGCGGTADCGTCRGIGTVCNAQGQCVCTNGVRRQKAVDDECCLPQTCEDLGMQCGSHDDGCGETVQCGGCPSGKHCEGGVCTPDCMPKTCAEVGNACGALADGCGGTVSCGCPSGKQCEGGICKDIDPCATGICRWSGTIRQKWTFHGTGIGNAVTTLDVLEDTTYEVLGNSSGSTTTTQGWHWITDDSNICEHHVQYGGWDLSGHTESQVVSRFALNCAEPGTGGGCSFNFSDGGRSVTVQECSTCTSGTCCTAGCHDVGVGTTPAAHVFGMGTPTGPTLSGSNTYSEHLCSWGFCGTRTYDWTWNLSYGPIS